MRPIVVTGATGTVGSEVVQQLLGSGAAVRSPQKIAANPNLEVVAIDFAQPATLASAMEGAEHLFLLTAFTPAMIDQSFALVDAAQAAGIEHVVKLSALGAGPGAAIELGKWHTRGEEYLEASGLGWTHLRPNSFMQNYVTFHAEAIRTQNAFYLPHGDGSMSLIDAGDVAAAIDNHDVAAILSRVLGREIIYVDVSDEAARKAMADMGSPEVLTEALMGLNNIIRAGYTAVVTDAVESVTGRAPRSFEEFAADHAPAWS